MRRLFGMRMGYLTLQSNFHAGTPGSHSDPKIEWKRKSWIIFQSNEKGIMIRHLFTKLFVGR